MYDYLIVGAGFAGSVLAERLANGSRKRVLLCDRRNHVGGNAFDYYDEAGILVHKYGPHIFHTNSADIFEYLTRFTDWRNYEHRVLAKARGMLLPMPINLDTLNKLYGTTLDSKGADDYLASVRESREPVQTSEDVIVNTVGRELYELFFKNYTVKQWGLDPAELDASVTSRIPTRTNRDSRYFTDTFQAMPKHGYTEMFDKMLDSPNITIALNCDFREISKEVTFENLIYTGPIDAYFDNCYGKLPYRSISFKHETHDGEVFQPAAVVNYPNEHAYTRITEFKYLTGQTHQNTSIVYEYPQSEGDPYYPIPRPENKELYKKYSDLADKETGVRFVGRLATYKYYNMDQIVGQALTEYAKIVELTRREATQKAAVVA